jgi:hypothetical protein
LRGWLVAEGVTQVAMEATGVYWKPVWHVLERAPTLQLLLVNPAHFKNLPGRKTDVKDSEWLAQLLEDNNVDCTDDHQYGAAHLDDGGRGRTDCASGC